MQGTYKVGALSFDVEILDERSVYGRLDYRIKPVSGSGDKWVSRGSVMV